MNKGSLQITTAKQREFIDITDQISKILSKHPGQSGVLHLFNPHTTAGLTINEGADPDVQRDIISALNNIVPQLNYQHAEGNSPAHIMTLLTGSSLTIEVENRRLNLGTWQRVFFCEYDGPRSRSLNWKYIPDL